MERLQKAKLHVVDQGILDGEALQPFALEEILMRMAGETNEPIIHIWRHRRAFIAGLRDRRLPYVEQALQELREAGCATAVRNSGGAAVPLHAGVINVSMIMPKPAGTLDIYDDFAGMASFLSAVLAQAGIVFDTGEITGSYCPGEYDLSIGGRKFCGIAQRRRLDAYSVQAFVIAEGDGASTGETVRRFYERACGGRTDLGAPVVDPERMASLQQLTDGRMSVELFLRCLHDLLQTLGATDASGLPKRYEAETNQQIGLMRERYDR